MTVAELIEFLKGCDPEARVAVWRGCCSGTESLHSPEVKIDSDYERRTGDRSSYWDHGEDLYKDIAEGMVIL